MEGRLSIFGVPIDAVTLLEATDRLCQMLQEEGQHHVLTPNPEMLLAARSNEIFCSVLQSSALNVPDGYGLILASLFLGNPLPERVAGIDLLTALCLRIEGPVFLLGAEEGVAARAGEALRLQNPSLIIAGTHGGSPNPSEEEEILLKINASGAKLLFVAFGSPRQDLWIARNLTRMSGIRVAMGVGGSFDFLAGVRSRAPHWMRSVGFEWLWRLVQEPKRFRRILRAVFLFPLLVLLTENRSHS